MTVLHFSGNLNFVMFYWQASVVIVVKSVVKLREITAVLCKFSSDIIFSNYCYNQERLFSSHYYTDVLNFETTVLCRPFGI